VTRYYLRATYIIIMLSIANRLCRQQTLLEAVCTSRDRVFTRAVSRVRRLVCSPWPLWTRAPARRPLIHVANSLFCRDCCSCLVPLASPISARRCSLSRDPARFARSPRELTDFRATNDTMVSLYYSCVRCEWRRQVNFLHTGRTYCKA